MKSRQGLSERQKKIFGVAAILLFAAFSVAVFLLAGRPLIRFVSDPERFREWVNARGVWGRAAFVGMTVLQVVVALIPGEPLEIGAGYAFGAVEGTLLSMLGIVIGSSLVFGFVRIAGIRAVEIFFPREKINSLSFLRDTKRLNLLMFLVFLIPGTPKDLLSYFAGLTNIRFRTFLLISAVARIPSVVTSAVGGDALGTERYLFAGAAFLVTAAVSAAGLFLYRKISRRADKTAEGAKK